MTKEGLRQRPGIHSADTQIQKKYTQACSKLHSLCLERCVCMCVCVWERDRERGRQIAFLFGYQKHLEYLDPSSWGTEKKGRRNWRRKKKNMFEFFFIFAPAWTISHTHRHSVDHVFTHMHHIHTYAHTAARSDDETFFFSHITIWYAFLQVRTVFVWSCLSVFEVCVFVCVCVLLVVVWGNKTSGDFSVFLFPSILRIHGGVVYTTLRWCVNPSPTPPHPIYTVRN